jgi:hypothetical protein
MKQAPCHTKDSEMLCYRTSLNRLRDLAPRLCAPLLHGIVMFCSILHVL